jgi:hypothetical protein
MVSILHNLSARAYQPEIWTKRALYSCQGRNVTDLTGRRITSVSIPEPDAPRGILGTSDGAPWIFGGNETLRLRSPRRS